MPSDKAWRDEPHVQEMLRELAGMRAHDPHADSVEVDELIVALHRAGSPFREIAEAGRWKSVSSVHARAMRALNRERLAKAGLA